MKTLFTLAIVLTILLSTAASGTFASNKLRDAPTGGSIFLNSDYFYKATQLLKSSFDTSVLNTFSAPALNGPLPSLNPCIISYNTLGLASFTETDITFTPITTSTNATTTAIHQITVHNPVFTLRSFPYTASCVFSSGVGLLNTQTSGTISGTWSVPNITVQITETVSGQNSSSQGAVVVSAATLLTDVQMNLQYNYDAQPVVGAAFVWDQFWQHHVQNTLQTTVRQNIASLFNQGGAPISILTNNMNAILSQWPQVCNIDQLTIPGTTILNTYPLCKTVLVDGLPTSADFATVEVSVGKLSEEDKKKFLAHDAASLIVLRGTGTCNPGSCWLPTGYSNYLVTYSDCTQCSMQQGQITGTSGTVSFAAN